MAGGGSGGVENSSSKNVVLGNLWSRLRILEAFLISPKSLSISLFFLAWGRGGGGGRRRLRVSAFYTEGYRIFGLVVFCHLLKLLLLVEL